jgi:hypothetical protein
LLAHWDGRAYAPGEPGGSSPAGTDAAAVTDGPAATLFAQLHRLILNRLFAGLPPQVSARLNTLSTESHQYDVTPMDNLALRVIRPHWAGLPPPSVVLSVSRQPAAILKHALATSLSMLTKRFGKQIGRWRRHHGVSHLDSLTGVVGPSSTEPFLDRGSWVQQVAL